MNMHKKNQVKKVVSWGAVAALAAVLAAMPLLAESRAVEEGPRASILSDTAGLRTVQTNLLGGGTLTAEAAVEITIPAEVKLTEFLVKNGDAVAKGDPIADLDRVSVMSAIALVQETLDTLEEEIEDAAGEENADTVKTQTGGTVKAVYAQAGDDVQSVMLKYGALAVLSLDDRMAVDVERRTDLAGGDGVCVTLSDGTEVEGRVESNLDGVLVVTVADEGYPIGEAVALTTEDGDRIGTGELYVHAPWNAVAYNGTVKRVSVKEGDKVSAGRTLFTLEDAGITASYQLLVNTHREYEALMLELFQLYQSQTLTAPCDGVVTGIDENSAYMLSAEGEWRITLLANAPNGDDETSYSNYVGQVKEVGIDGLILRLNPQAVSVDDYKDLSGVNLDTERMTEEVIHVITVPIYTLSGEEWVQIGAETLTAGDILLFAGDASGNMVWVVKVGHVDAEPDPEEPTQPTDPSEPTDPTQPGENTESTVPGGEQQIPSGSGQQQMPQSGGMAGGFSGSSGGYSGGAQQEEETYYDLSVVTVASVIPQGEVTVEITVDEMDIHKVKTGSEVTVTVSALSGQRFAGTVTEISTEGTNEGGSSKFTATVTLNRGEDMLTGMNAAVKLTVEELENVLTIPVAALTEEGSRTLVYTGYDAEKELLLNPVEVTTGISDGEYVQILSGLSENDEIYYAYYDTLTVSLTPDSGISFR